MGASRTVGGFAELWALCALWVALPRYERFARGGGGICRVMDALRAVGDLPRYGRFAHCEWLLWALRALWVASMGALRTVGGFAEYKYPRRGEIRRVEAWWWDDVYRCHFVGFRSGSAVLGLDKGGFM